MDLAIAIGQGAGLAVACGLIAGLPIAIAALAALASASLEPGAVASLDSTRVVGAVCGLAVADAAAEPFLPERVDVGLRAIAGAVCFELVAGHELPWAGLAAGLAIAGATALVAVRLTARAARAGSRGATVLLAAGAAALTALAALIPFVGYALVIAAAWLGLRLRRREGERYAGLRILR